MANPPASRRRPDPQLKGPPQSKLEDLNIQVQGCQKATQRVQEETKWQV